MKKYDDIIVGGGIAGLGCAFALSRKKKRRRILIVDREDKAGEATQASAGILDPLLEMKASSPLLPLGLSSSIKNPGYYKEIQRISGMDLGYAKTGMLYVSLNAKESKMLENWYRWQKRKKVRVCWMDPKAVLKKFPGVNPQIKKALFYPDYGKVNPRKLKSALKNVLRKRDVEFIKSTKDCDAFFNSKGMGGILVGSKIYEARNIVNAMGSWSGKTPLAGLRMPVSPVRGQIMIVKGNTSLKTTLHGLDGSYIVPWKKNHLLLGSTVEKAGYKVKVTRSGLSKIKKAAIRLLPEIAGMKQVDAWAGLRPSPPDGRPILGKGPYRGLFYATGYYRSGVLIGLFAGDLLANFIISGKMPRALRAFSPKRFMTYTHS